MRERLKTYAFNRELGVQHAVQVAVLNALAPRDANRGLFSAREVDCGRDVGMGNPVLASGEGACCGGSPTPFN
jgi:hypothetical protein